MLQLASLTGSSGQIQQDARKALETEDKELAYILETLIKAKDAQELEEAIIKILLPSLRIPKETLEVLSKICVAGIKELVKTP